MSARNARHGWVPDRPDFRDHYFDAAASTLASLPRTVDLRPQCPPVYDQGKLGSCTANAIAAAIQFDRMRQELDAWVPSRLFIYWNERARENAIASDAGARIRDGVKTVASQGDVPETEWPYHVRKFAERPPRSVFAKAKKYKVVRYQRIKRDLAQMKGCLAEGFPFVYGITIYSSFPMRHGNIPMPKPKEQTDGGHAMLAVGYDDKKASFVVRNSWGNKWGDDGYGYLPFAYLMHTGLSQDFWTIRVVER